MDNLPRIEFVSSPNTEIERILFTSLSIANGFYKRKGFVILPTLQHRGSPQEVVLPQLAYSDIEDYWGRVVKLQLNFPIRSPHRLREEMRELFGNRQGLHTAQLSARKRLWSQRESVIWLTVERAFPDVLRVIDAVEVRLTRYGTISSFSVLGSSYGQKLICYLRSDADLGNLAEVVMSALLFQHRKEHKLRWSEAEAIVDFLMTNREMKRLFPQYKRTLQALTRVDPKLRRQSTAYLKKLEVVYEDKILEVVKDAVYVKGKKVEATWSRQEMGLLKLFLSKEGDIVPFDEVADFLWGEGELVSLWALNKAVQRVRYKLVSFGLPNETLQTMRKRGYLLELPR